MARSYNSLLWPTLQTSGTLLQLTAMANTAGQWHALIVVDCYGQYCRLQERRRGGIKRAVAAAAISSKRRRLCLRCCCCFNGCGATARGPSSPLNGQGAAHAQCVRLPKVAEVSRPINIRFKSLGCLMNFLQTTQGPVCVATPVNVSPLVMLQCGP